MKMRTEPYKLDNAKNQFLLLVVLPLAILPLASRSRFMIPFF